MKVVLQVKKWGDSFVLIVPTIIARNENITVGDLVDVEIVKKVDMNEGDASDQKRISPPSV